MIESIIVEATFVVNGLLSNDSPAQSALFSSIHHYKSLDKPLWINVEDRSVLLMFFPPSGHFHLETAAPKKDRRESERMTEEVYEPLHHAIFELENTVAHRLVQTRKEIFGVLSSFEQSVQLEAKKMKERMEEIAEMMKKKQEELDEKSRSLSHLQQKMLENFQSLQDRVELDVGGRIFSASKSIFLNHPHSYFYALLSSGRWKPDKEGDRFVCSV